MSSPITFSGFNSIDFNQILNLEMQQESQPLTALQTRQATLNGQNSAFATLAGKLSTLGTAVDNLKNVTSMSLLKATSSDAGVGVSTTTGTVPGTYSVIVNELAKGQVTASTSTYTDPTNVVATAGTLTLTPTTGSAVTVTLTGSTTLQQLVDQINAATGTPATASMVQSAPGSYQLVLSGTSSGLANAFTITSTLSGGKGLAFKDTDGDGKSGNSVADNTQSAIDAAFTVNGLPVTSSSNSVSNVIPGVTLSLNKKDPATSIAISVTRDTTGAEALVNKFIAAYNDVIKFTKDQKSAAANGYANIARDPLLSGFKGTMRTAMMDTYGGTYDKLAGIGLGFDRDGNMTLDTATFDKALTTSPAAVQQLFSGSDGTGGAFGRMSTIIDSYTDAGGLLSTTRNRLDTEVADIGKRMDTMTALLDIRRKALQQEYIAADLAMTQLKNQSAQISSVGSSLSFQK